MKKIKIYDKEIEVPYEEYFMPRKDEKITNTLMESDLNEIKKELKLESLEISDLVEASETRTKEDYLCYINQLGTSVHNQTLKRLFAYINECGAYEESRKEYKIFLEEQLGQLEKTTKLINNILDTLKEKTKGITGKDVISLLERMVHFDIGKPFTAFVDLDVECPGGTGDELDKAMKDKYHKIYERLKPMYEQWNKLRESLFETEVLINDPSRGTGLKQYGVDLGKQLTEEQTESYNKINKFLDELDTFIE